MKKIYIKILDLFFFLGVPVGLSLLVFFQAEEVELTSGYTLGFFGILFAILILLIVKKYKFNPYFKEVRQILANHKADYEIETDEIKKEKLRTSINKRKKMILTYDRVSIFIVLLILYLGINYIADNISQLQAILGWTMISMGVGTAIDYKWDNLEE